MFIGTCFIGDTSNLFDQFSPVYNSEVLEELKNRSEFISMEDEHQNHIKDLQDILRRHKILMKKIDYIYKDIKSKRLFIRDSTIADLNQGLNIMEISIDYAVLITKASMKKFIN